MANKKDVVKDEVEKKTLQAKNKADELKVKTSKKQAEVKDKAVDVKGGVKDKALEVKKGALEKTADAKESALMKTAEIKEGASEKTSELKEGATEKTSELKEGATEKTAEFKDNAEKTRKQAERKINEFISTLKDKQEEFGKTISDYTSAEMPLTDIIDTEDSVIIIADLPGVKKKDISINITEDSVELVVKFKKADENLVFIKKERNYGKTTRNIALPELIEVKKAVAKFNDSVLTLELPKVQEEKFKVKIE